MWTGWLRVIQQNCLPQHEEPLLPSQPRATCACSVHPLATPVLTTNPPAVSALPATPPALRHPCRYKNFLGLNNPNDFMAAAAQMKGKGDFTSLRDDAQAIAAVRAEGMPADKVLAINTVAEGEAAARWVADGTHPPLVGSSWVCMRCTGLALLTCVGAACACAIWCGQKVL